MWRCAKCYGTDVFFDGYIGVNDPTDLRVFDATYCLDCGMDCDIFSDEDWAKEIERPSL